MTPDMLLHSIFSLLFGLFLTVTFAGVRPTGRNLAAHGILALLLLMLTAVAALLAGPAAVPRLYPLLVHLPLVLYLVLFCKCPALLSVASTLSAYLCCQLPRWLSRLIAAGFGGNLYVEGAAYVLSVVLFSWFFLRYAAKPVNEMMRTSRRSLLAYAMVPLVYYIFDYVTTVYTDLLYSGNWYVVQFMPTVISLFYFLFVIAYRQEYLRRIETQREQDMLAGYLHRSQIEISALRQTQQDAMAYRHDMRHHLNLLQNYAARGDLEHIRAYLIQANTDLDRITSRRFCGNESINLICSHFAAQAEQRRIDFATDIRLPETIPLPETQLCALLSNSLENAVNAVSALPEEARQIRLRLRLHQENLLILVENPCAGPVDFADGLPQSRTPGHGYGARSIAAIVKNNRGQLLFSAENGLFRMQAAIPLPPSDGQDLKKNSTF